MSNGGVDNIGILKTKCSVPILSKQLLPRRIANHRLEGSLNHKLTLITAPAGYGKTSTVLKWLQDSSLPTAWLSIDTGDNDALVFWRYFCAALESIAPDITKDTPYVFESQELFKANVHLNILIEILSCTASDIIFVLDDLHLISNPAVLDGLSHFIAYMPSNMHLILISRVEPRLKLARLGLKEELIRIRAEDLRFETEEISQYYKARGYLLQQEDVERIEIYTEGWAAALVAVALSLKDEKHRSHVIRSFGSCNHHIENYLAEDVFNTWTRDQQEFMLKTAILGRLCGSLCEAVTDNNGSTLLKELYEQNSFLEALDDEGIWFRYHHLFSDFLNKKLKSRDAAFIQHLHHKAGEWLKANSYLNEAIEHFIKGSSYEEAVALIEKHGRALVRQGEYSSVMSWIRQLPDQYVQKSAVLFLIKTVFYTEAGNFKKAWECIGKAELLINEEALPNKSYHTEFHLTKINIFFQARGYEEHFSHS